MLGWAIALLLTFAPPDAVVTSEVEPAPADAEPPSEQPKPEVATGKLVLIPGQAERLRIIDSHEQVEQLVDAGPDHPVELELAPGIYYVQDQTGATVAVAVLVSNQALVWDGQHLMSADSWARRAPRELQPPPAPPQPIPPPIPESSPPEPNHRLWAAPLASTLLPGTGQLINRQGGKGIGVMFGTVAAVLGSVALYRLDNHGRRSLPAEYARLIGYGVLSTAAPMLWLYGIADGYRVAADQTIEPHLDHRLRISVGRTMTVGFRADVRRPGFYDNWSAALMGQATRRLTVGVADLWFSPGGSDVTQVGQFGVRLDYRVFEHPRLWLDLGLGTAMQIATRRGPRPLDPEQPLAKRELSFAAIPYGYFDVRCFVLDRMSLDFTPRLSVPVTTRYFSANRSLPRFAPSLELGAGVSVYF